MVPSFLKEPADFVGCDTTRRTLGIGFENAAANLAGIKRIIELEQATFELQRRLQETEEQLARAQARLAEIESLAYPRRDLVPARSQSTTALVVWKPRNPRA